ncbi:hypothetical protein [Halanaerobacter jeridensis]|uniref:Uncharacterized protein n=1 Tax=Halanaerobacter jeridensis TaxID=706427 RepID=A0A938XYH7_9FIRM|nr:hypothetical protein [Halanaerobacter jeridensis]MBM7557625.1 hypothetical protein [Halanaerobacter jeridensis]
MANATYIFKDKAKELIDEEEMKVWLSKKHGRRVEYVFKVGTEQFSPPTQLAEEGDYVLFSQGTTDEVEQELKELFGQFIK